MEKVNNFDSVVFFWCDNATSEQEDQEKESSDDKNKN